MDAATLPRGADPRHGQWRRRGIPSNLVQADTGIVIALVLVALLKGSKALDKIAVQW